MNKPTAAKQYRFSKTQERGFRSLKNVVGVESRYNKQNKQWQQFFVEKVNGKKRLFNINSNLTKYRQFDKLTCYGLR